MSKDNEQAHWAIELELVGSKTEYYSVVTIFADKDDVQIHTPDGNLLSFSRSKIRKLLIMKAKPSRPHKQTA